LVEDVRPFNTGVEPADGTRLEADLIVSAVGDVPDVEWLASSGWNRSPHRTDGVNQAWVAVHKFLRGDGAAPYRPSQYCWTEQFDLDVKRVGAPDPQGESAMLDGSLDAGCGFTLLAWPDKTSAATT
jgi:3-phenylpropionate/trans-cinnamate dioxygenase ferredoxin reductase component